MDRGNKKVAIVCLSENQWNWNMPSGSIGNRLRAQLQISFIFYFLDEVSGLTGCVLNPLPLDSVAGCPTALGCVVLHIWGQIGPVLAHVRSHSSVKMILSFIPVSTLDTIMWLGALCFSLQFSLSTPSCPAKEGDMSAIDSWLVSFNMKALSRLILPYISPKFWCE